MASQSLYVLAITPSASQFCSCSIKSNNSLLLSLPSSSLFGSRVNVLISSSNLSRFAVKHRQSTLATVLFSLPTGKPERASSEKLPKWSARAIKSFAMGELEARKLKYPQTGTEALLMGILVEGTSQAAKFLRANGITLFEVRDKIIELLGKSDMYFFSPEHPPLTEPAQRALDWALDEKLKSGVDGEVTAAHFLLGLWSDKDSAAHKIMADMGFDDEKAKELYKIMDKDVVLSYKQKTRQSNL